MQILSLFRNSKKRLFHKILVDEPHIDSLASYLLMKKDFERLDPYIKEQKIPFRIWLTFRNRLLLRLKKQNKGNLICTYCRREHLVTNFQLKGIRQERKATLDHVVPLAKGGMRFDESNLVACCSKCNEKKGHLREFPNKP